MANWHHVGGTTLRCSKFQRRYRNGRQHFHRDRRDRGGHSDGVITSRRGRSQGRRFAGTIRRLGTRRGMVMMARLVTSVSIRGRACQLAGEGRHRARPEKEQNAHGKRSHQRPHASRSIHRPPVQVGAAVLQLNPAQTLRPSQRSAIPGLRARARTRSSPRVGSGLRGLAIRSSSVLHHRDHYRRPDRRRRRSSRRPRWRR